MNEQELILTNKIEKREKFDTILAYILIVILVACIGIVLYLKFIRKEETTTPEEYVPNYISLNDISTSLNNSTLANRYLNDNAIFNSSVSDSSLMVTYVKDDTNINLNIPMVGNELEVTIPLNNTEIVTDIYKEITSIICVHYGNSENKCRSSIDNINSDNSIDGVRFVNDKIYINITKSIDLNIIYNSVTKTNIDNTNYSLKMLDSRISNISILKGNTDILFKGTIERLTDDTSNVSVIVKLYDNKDNLIGENKKEYNEDSPLNGSDIFEISFILNDTLKLENISSYSIEVFK